MDGWLQAQWKPIVALGVKKWERAYYYNGRVNVQRSCPDLFKSLPSNYFKKCIETVEGVGMCAHACVHFHSEVCAFLNGLRGSDTQQPLKAKVNGLTVTCS